MTIAAGFRCDGGVLLCSDSLISGGSVNNQQRKIIPFNLPQIKANVAIALAGSVPHCLSVIGRLSHKLNQISAATGLDDALFVSVFEDVLAKFHAKHLFPHPHYRYDGGPSVYFIAAVQYQEKQRTSLFTTSETVVSQTYDFAFTGIGESIARYIVEPLAKTVTCSLGDDQVLLIADHMLHQVKRFVPGCGDASQFFYLGDNGAFHPPVHGALLPEDRSETFRRIMADLFFASANLDLDDDAVALSVELTDQRIKNIRKEQRAEREKRRQLGAKIFANPIIGVGPFPRSTRIKRQLADRTSKGPQ